MYFLAILAAAAIAPSVFAAPVPAAQHLGIDTPFGSLSAGPRGIRESGPLGSISIGPNGFRESSPFGSISFGNGNGNHGNRGGRSE
jgi:hypothetical protein